jgi:hypothetical protein
MNDKKLSLPGWERLGVSLLDLFSKFKMRSLFTNILRLPESWGLSEGAEYLFTQ